MESGSTPILSAEEWQQLQDRLTIRRETPHGKAHYSVYILSGITRRGHCRGTMAGRTGAMHKCKLCRNYHCSRAMHPRELCGFHNGHSVRKLEKAVLEYLGQFSDPDLVKQYLGAADREEVALPEAQLREI